jgi:hypothetical protein
MAGTLPGFNPDEVRAGLHLAMQVGLPPIPDDQPKFYFAAAATTDDNTDGQGTPLSWQAARVDAPAKPVVSVPCAIEYLDDAGAESGYGYTASSQLVLTFLDEDYEQVKGFSHVLIAGNTYRYQKTQPPVGLLEIGIWQVHVRTADEG